MQFRELDAAKFATVRRKLIQSKGSDMQRDFLSATRDKSSFKDWFNTHVPYSSLEERELPVYPEKLTENEFKDTTSNVEKLAFDTWSELTPKQACRSSFWGAVTLNHLQNDIIETSNLAAGNANQSGLSRIEQALKDNDSKLTDDTVRTILRRFSGLPEARGGLRTVYVNCAFGRAWWRERMIKEVSKLTSADEKRIRQVLRSSQEYWEKLVMVLVTSNSVFGDEKIRTSLIWALSDHVNDPKYSDLFKSKGPINECMNILGVYSAYQEFAVFQNEELRDFMNDEVIRPVMNLK